MKFGKIDPIALGVSLGALSGISTFFMGLMVLIFNKGKPFAGVMGTIYMTYDLSLLQCVLAGVGVFVSTFITSFLIAWLYNILSKQV
ncbi:hypothetical protein OQJ19_00530 [Fluoribacter gormanii]|uniref:Uncharacterized protein n=1 Tax=Fluoribacter gormanii TaxID=464 RepID=A0A377GI22_9GAMM|nr:hypothetical protein [Fluoribacter gormanii]KTD03451.1 hypothetical protein Lgor_1436 [Fluoribacter gormanii]MCW8443962.1 hypothetical protein [Fluoribacter gormanii]MCW8469144.1 hypothetical protein [Fluoribacter gormanii]SIQ48175.1 hypothetical protein SAMN05421777_101128 [Fluoribacter gormanii]STO24479.1 Uncharacterised protein [Fluoribacter gormanii]